MGKRICIWTDFRICAFKNKELLQYYFASWFDEVVSGIKQCPAKNAVINECFHDIIVMRNMPECMIIKRKEIL